MKKEFNLSNHKIRICEPGIECDGFALVDIKEFIKILRENYNEKLRSIKEWMELDNAIYSQDYDKMKANQELLRTLKSKLNKLAGADLI